MSIERAKALVGALSDGIGSDVELRDLLTMLPPMLDDAAAWRKGWEVLREMRARVIPCGHKVEDLIGGEGSVTKCGACLRARQEAKGEVKLNGIYADAKAIVDNAVKVNDAEVFKWIEGDGDAL